MRSLLLVPLLVAGVLALALFDGDAGALTWLRLRAELAASEERRASLRADIDRLRVEARALESDEFAIERAIREDLGYARPGETRVRLPATEGASEVPTSRIP